MRQMSDGKIVDALRGHRDQKLAAKIKAAAPQNRFFSFPQAGTAGEKVLSNSRNPTACNVTHKRLPYRRTGQESETAEGVVGGTR